MLRDLTEVIVITLTGTLVFLGLVEIFNAFIKHRPNKEEDTRN